MLLCRDLDSDICIIVLFVISRMCENILALNGANFSVLFVLQYVS